MTGVTFSPKPEGAAWTDDQWRAVSAEGSNILVAAAAGSGKTAVLVERIIRKISNDADVDRLLVATFTKAAASEMKERVRIALEVALERNPESEHLRRQLALINRSSITTLHSFCLDVIRSYYPLIGLDPGFRMAGETESELLRIDALDALFEHKYTGEDADSGIFMMLADRYGGERGDEPLYRLVQKLYDFSRSNPWPDHWLRETAAKFRFTPDASLSDTEWVEAAKADVHLSLIGAAGLLEQALELTRRPAGPAPYAETLSDDLNMVSELLGVTAIEPWEAWAERFAGIAFGKLKTMRGDEYDKTLQQRTKDLRDKVKGLLSGVAERWFHRTPEQYRAELEELTPMMETLSELVIDFGKRYEALKRDKGLLDFSDLEHGCLSILRDSKSTPEQEVPSVAALEYRERFVEILLDEYQDTNTVQEAIVSLIARPDNRFMVGDVKQSIYRFRLAEPNLFLHKYKTYMPADLVGKRPTEAASAEKREQGVRIDLARNFRSRSEVVDGVNGIFRAVMHENVGELEYDERAELVCGASYPSPDVPGRCASELVLVDRSGSASAQTEEETMDADSDSESEDGAPRSDAADLQTAQLEARVIARRILDLLAEGHPVWDGKRKAYRPLQMRDIVILLRATASWAPILIEELQTFGIPAYAELGTGYFDATEVEVMMSLLRVIDNPYQDIPLAGVLRSPIFGLTAEELAKVRINAGKGSFYDAVRRAAAQENLREEIRLKLDRFLTRLEQWRETARQGAVTEMLAALYRETGYYDFVGGLPGGLQRQANLRALLDRARQYESTSFRGLFRFLRFIERMRDTGGDLGTARALGEQEDVVRIMSIHKSKGLEFPVVFVAGLGKMFNMQDLNAPFLLHKELGYGPKFIDAELRVSYPTLPCLAIGRKLRMEMLAEEMRILYVALTRPKEKMILVGTLNDAVAKLEEWAGAIDTNGRLTDDRLAAARSYIDWIGPLAAGSGVIGTTKVVSSEPSDEAQAVIAVDDLEARVLLDGRTPIDRLPLDGWRFAVMPASLFAEESAIVIEADEEQEREKRERMQAIGELAIMESSDAAEEVDRLLSWTYNYTSATTVPAKTSVTEMKRLHDERETEAELLMQLQEMDQTADIAFGESRTEGTSNPSSYTFRLRRPRFMEENALTAAERGTASHLLMQHVPLDKPVTLEILQALVDDLISRRIMTKKQAEAIQLEPVVELFTNTLGQRILAADWVKREVPFSCAFPASRIYGQHVEGSEDEPILIQGVVDCLFRDQEGIVLLDYKTDQVYMQQWDRAAEKHRFQLELYAEALEMSLGLPIQESYVHFLSGGVTVRLR
ncbi:DNA helicase/exodeoxyribonuclease V subunit A [Paenibacillus cellulosilyticus]|uniref:ATP-dependent helicase/nuclease subunit A n=1 Tax=Paenibacillus cellulosilyticus TaxID=375489 RepID=A0A2V2YQI6_9BACL|nr:helicase-exonuclease AddAB subunit AddA [Paenibacillus cellulosilyticus]PWV95400.1 DNA helicase/exodeoxyribonuclease V subunit A [Paenibacillus cellulosilyticus]QKS43217.1 helicase-exonuclease AddAB subunit AddA [Paenibacillus cellulosilyticus]